MTADKKICAKAIYSIGKLAGISMFTSSSFKFETQTIQVRYTVRTMLKVPHY